MGAKKKEKSSPNRASLPLKGAPSKKESRGAMEKIKKYRLNFTQVPNAVLQDNRLSLKAKGLYAYLFSKPDGWKFHAKVILSEIREKRDCFYAAMKELVKYGYIQRYQENINGVFGSNVYKFIDPDDVPREEKPCAENPYTEKPYTENPDAYNNTDNNNIKNNNIYNNNININNIHTREKIKSVDYGNTVLIGDDYKLNFEDEIFSPYFLANKGLSESIEKWLIKTNRGKIVDKKFICSQIINFAKRQGVLGDLMGITNKG